jgi:PAS domain S-box-containing protein
MKGELSLEISQQKKDAYLSKEQAWQGIGNSNKSDKLLKESEEFNRKLIEKSLDGIWMIDSGGKIVFANERLHKMLGYEKEEMLEQNFLEFIVDEDKEYAWKLLFGSECEDGGVYDISFQDISGNVLHTMVSISPNISEDGRFLGAFAYIKDITDRKKAEEITEFLRDAATRILSFKDPVDRYQLLLDKLLKLTNSRYGYIGYIEEDTGYLIVPTMTKNIWNVCNVKDKDVVYKEFTGLWGWGLKNKKAVLCNDRSQDERSVPLPEGHLEIDNFLSVPCIIEGKIAGQVGLANKPGGYTKDDLHIVERFAQLVVLTISAHKAEDASKKSAARYRELTESISDIFFALDKNLNYTYWNGATEKLTGIKAEDALHKNLVDVSSNTRNTIIQKTYKKVIKTKNPVRLEEVELENGKVDGFFDIEVYPSRDGISVFVKDVTERKKIREEIEYLNKQLLSIIEMDQQIASSLELDGLLSRVCELVIEMLDLKMAWVGLVEKGSHEIRPAAWSGFEKGYLINTKMTYDDSEYAKGPTGTATREKRAVIQNNIRTDQKFKPWREEAIKRGYLSSAAIPLICRGNVLGTVNVYSAKEGFFNDSVVEVLKNYANRVAIAIENARLYEETRRAYEGLKAVDSLKDEMLSNVSHELKTPVTIMSGFLELFLSSEFGEITDEQRDVIETIKRNTRRLIRLIENLVTLRGLEFHEISLEREIIFPNEMLEEVIEETKNFIERKDLSFEYDIQDDLPLIRGDKYKIVQVVFNLIDNAIKFTPPGGEIKIKAKSLRKNIKISVEDTGIGIFEEEIPNIFKRFYQIDGSTTRKYSGTGIGLTISKDIVEAHGGKITVKTKHSTGCIFSFTIPIFEKKSRR